MKYFVTTSDGNDLWKIELLIESFKIVNLEDSLIVGISKSTANLYPKNLLEHKHKIEIKNSSNSCFDRFTLLKKVMESGLLEETFTLIHSDTLFVKPIPNILNDCSMLVFENKKSEVCKQWWESNQNVPWMELGGNMILHKFPIAAIDSAISFAVSQNNIVNIEPIIWNFIVNLFKIITTPHSFTMGVKEPIDASFIHYNESFLPYFDKREFDDRIGVRFSEEGNPINALKSIPSTVGTYIKIIIDNYQKKSIDNFKETPNV